MIIVPATNPYATRILFVDQLSLLTTENANYVARREISYEPITGGIHVRRVSLERIPTNPQHSH